MDKPVYVLAIDGCDGTGKTSLIKALIERYSNRTIVLPKSSQMGLMPNSFEEKIRWFRSENPFVTGRIYLMSHLARFSLIRRYAQRGHWRSVQLHRSEGPLLVLIDRGILSLQCYTTASIMLKSSLSSQLIWDWVNLQYKNLQKDSLKPDWSILLQPDTIDTEAVERLLQRTATPLEDRAIEHQLIHNQLQLFHTYSGNNHTIMNPFSTREEIQNRIFAKLDAIFSRRDTTDTHIFYLDDIISQIQGLATQGNLWLCRGIVEKGYTNNDFDVICEKEADGQLLTSLFGEKCHIINAQPKDEPWTILFKR